MNKYKIEDLKVGAVFKDGDATRTILLVGKTDVFYSYRFTSDRIENICPLGDFLRGDKGALVVPTKKIAYVEFQSNYDLVSKHYCSKEVWYREINASTNHKFIREFEIEVGEDGFPIERGV